MFMNDHTNINDSQTIYLRLIFHFITLRLHKNNINLVVISIMYRTYYMFKKIMAF